MGHGVAKLGFILSNRLVLLYFMIFKRAQLGGSLHFAKIASKLTWANPIQLDDYDSEC